MRAIPRILPTFLPVRVTPMWMLVSNQVEALKDNCFDPTSKEANPVPTEENILILQGHKERE